MKPHHPKAIKFHKLLPPRLWRYLNDRGISDSVISNFCIGWNGQRITIPIYGRSGDFAFFRLARDPAFTRPAPKMLSEKGSRTELYGWEHLKTQPTSLVICEGEFDRLVLVSNGFAAVTSTGGAGVFNPLWAARVMDIPYVYACFDLDEAGRLGAERVCRLVPHARIVRLPSELGQGGDVTDFFSVKNHSAQDFQSLLDRAQPLSKAQRAQLKPLSNPLRVGNLNDEVARLKAHTSIEWVVNHYMSLKRSGSNYIGRCPFHPDRTPSFVVFPKTQSFHCFGCKASGDCISFVMRRESLSFQETLLALKSLHDL